MAEGKQNSNCFRILALTYIAIHQSCAQLPSNLQLILFFIRHLQTIAFLVLRQLDPQVLIFNYTIQSYLFEYQYILVYFILITTILYFSYLVVIAYLIQADADQSEIQESLLNRMFKQKLYTTIGNIFTIWFQELLCSILFLPFFYALVLDLSGKDGNTKVYLQFLDIVCIILITLIYIAYLMFLEQSLNFSKHQFQRITNSSIHYLIIILEMLQVACATIDKSSTIFYFNSLFQFLQIFLTVYDIFVNYSLVNLQQMNVILFAISIQLTVLGTVFTIYLGDFQQNYYILLIIIIPITYQLFHQTLTIHIFESVMNNTLDIKEQTFQVIYILTHHKKFRQFRALLFGKHRRSCFKVNCHCKSQFKFDLYDSANNYFFNFLKRNVVVKLGKLIDNVTSEDLNYFFHYIIALNELGFTTQAFQQISFIQSSDRRKILKSLNGSMFNTNTTESRLNRRSKSIINRLESSQSHPEQVNHDEEDDQDIERKPVEMNFIESCRFEILSQIIRQSMSFNIGSSSQDQINTQHMVSLFILQENNNLKVTNQIIQIFKGKIQYLRNLGTINHNQLKNLTHKLNGQLHNLHKSLLIRYEHFPSHKLQLTLGFVQAELMNNYYLAYKTMNVMSIKDEKIFDQFDVTRGINFFSKNVSYLICEYQTNSLIKIANFSPNSPKFFDYKLEEFKKLDTIDYLLPPTIQTVHDKFVGKFLQTGLSKYFSNCETSYCMNNYGAVECVQMLYDINYQDSKAFSFILFLQKTKPEQVMFVSEDGIVGGATDKLVQQFGYKSIGQEELRNLYKTKVKSIIPSFQEIIELAEASNMNNSLTLKYSNAIVKERVQVNFPSPALNHMPTRFESFSAQSKISLKNYLAVIRIQVQNIKGRTYYQVNFLDIRNVETQSYATSHVSDQFDMVWSLSDASSPPPNQPKVLELKQAFPSLEDQIRIYVHQPMKLEMVPQDVILKGDQDDDFYNSLISQNRGFEQTGIIDKTQQQFFVESYRDRHSSFLQNNIEQSSNIVSDFQKSSNAIDQLLLKDVLQCFPKQLVVKESKQVYDNNHKQSEVTASGFRSSKYFWKYTFFNRLTQERLQVSEFSKSFILLIMYFLVCLACTIMIFVITQTDFDDIQKQMRLIYMRKTIMSPISRSLLAQIIDHEYDEVFAAGIVDEYQHKQISQYIVARGQQEFDTLKSNLLGVIEDPRLAQFFKNLNDDMYISDDTNKPPLVMVESFRTQLINIVSSQLAEAQWQIHGIQFPTVNFENFGLANYEKIFNLMETLSDSVLTYTQSLADNYNSKAILITLIFIFISVLIISISFGYQFSVIRFYEKTFELRMFIQKDFLQKEIDRLVLLSTMIENNRNLIQNYQFKLLEKEEYLQYLEKARPVQDKFMKQNVVLTRSRLMMLLSHLITLCIFLSFTLGQLISSNSFFNDLNPTLSYLFDMSEIVSIINSAYVANELSYFANLPNYAFLGTDSKTSQKEIIQLSVNRLNVFLGVAYSISTLSIINGERFKNQFQLYASNDVCAVFDSTYMSTASYVCQYSISGNLKLGFVPSIIFIQKIFQQDLQTLNFTRTVFDYPVNQIEATLVIGDCMDLLSGYLFDDVSSYTDSIQILKHIVSGVHLFYLMIFLTLCYKIYQRAYRESYQMRQYLTLNPIYTMILENQFERAIRSLVLRQEWL